MGRTQNYLWVFKRLVTNYRKFFMKHVTVSVNMSSINFYPFWHTWMWTFLQESDIAIAKWIVDLCKAHELFYTYDKITKQERAINHTEGLVLNRKFFIINMRFNTYLSKVCNSFFGPFFPFSKTLTSMLKKNYETFLSFSWLLDKK